MNPDSENWSPLTVDELIRLVAFLAERGHTDVARRVAYDAVVVAMSEAVAR